MKAFIEQTLRQAPRSFWLSLALMAEVVGLTLYKPVWLFHLLLVGRMVVDLVVPGYFVPIDSLKIKKQPSRAPIHQKSPKPYSLV